jgi:hypothetical protein
VGELLDDLVAEYKANGRRDDRLAYSLAHLRPAFGHYRAMQVTTAAVNAFIVARQGEKAASATINRELAALKRAYSLATQATPPKLYLRWIFTREPSGSTWGTRRTTTGAPS